MGYELDDGKGKLGQRQGSTEKKSKAEGVFEYSKRERKGENKKKKKDQTMNFGTAI